MDSPGGEEEETVLGPADGPMLGASMYVASPLSLSPFLLPPSRSPPPSIFSTFRKARKMLGLYDKETAICTTQSPSFQECEDRVGGVSLLLPLRIPALKGIAYSGGQLVKTTVVVGWLKLRLKVYLYVPAVRANRETRRFKE